MKCMTPDHASVDLRGRIHRQAVVLTDSRTDGSPLAPPPRGSAIGVGVVRLDWGKHHEALLSRPLGLWHASLLHGVSTRWETPLIMPTATGGQWHPSCPSRSDTLPVLLDVPLAGT